MEKHKHLKRRRLRFKPLLRVFNLFPGEYPSVYKGEGEDFADLKPYQVGDDAKRIHWPHYAKTRELFVAERVVHKNLTIIVALDFSRSMSWSKEKLNILDSFLEILISSLIVNGSNSLGFLGFSSDIERYFPPRAGRAHFVQLVRWYMHYVPKRVSTDILQALGFLVKTVKPRSIIFFISDFFEKRDFGKELHLASQKLDFIPVVVQDPREITLLAGVRTTYQDLETQKIENLWLAHGRVSEIRLAEETRREKLADLFKKNRVYPLFLDSSETKAVVAAIHRFFQQRTARR